MGERGRGAVSARGTRAWRCGAAAIVCGLLSVGATVVNQTAVHWRENSADSHFFAYCGWCITQGAIPYLDVWDNKPPGLWWINALAIALCGPGPVADLLVGGAALLLGLAGFVLVARTLFGRALLIPAALVGAVVLTDVRFECGGNRTETWVIPCELFAVLGYQRWLRSRRLAWLVLGAVAAGAAPLFKQSGVAAAGACGLHLAYTQIRAWGHGGRPVGWITWSAAVLGLALPVGAAGVTLAMQGAAGEAHFAVLRFNRAYFAVEDATWLEVDRALTLYRPALAKLPVVLVLAAWGVAWGLLLRVTRRSGGRAPRRAGIGVVVLWLGLAVYLACVGPGRQAYHVGPVLAPLGLLALYPLHLLAGRRGLRVRLIYSPTAAILLVGYAYLLGTHYAGGWRAAARMWRQKATWNALAPRVPSDFELQACAIQKLAAPDERIYVWGWSPGTYRYALRLPASRHATLEKLGQVGPHARFILERAAADLMRRPPKVIVISPADYRPFAAGGTDPFVTWLRGRFAVRETVGTMHLLVRREGSERAP